MGRAPCCDKANVKKGPWSPEEDAALKSYIEKNGTGGNWIALPQKIGLKRCGKSCRLRWLNYLRPNIKHGGFTEEEDNIICSLYISIGSRWSIIAAQLPGRTDNDIKNYWNTRLKKKLLGRRKQSNLMNNQKDTIEDNNNSTNILSNSALERLQLHMQLQTLQNPFSLYNNPALWPNKLHPFQEKIIHQSLSNNNNNPLNLMQQNASLNSPANADGAIKINSLNLENNNNVPLNISVDPFVGSNNSAEQNDVGLVQLQTELYDILNNRTSSLGNYVPEFDCFKDMNGSSSVKDAGFIWWSNDSDSSKSASSNNSWDSSSATPVLLPEGMFQDYDQLGYTL